MAAAAAGGYHAPMGRAPAPQVGMRPKSYLFGWGEILHALELANDQMHRRRVQRLNREAEGPILTPGQGSHPRVNRAKLIAWWNALEARWEDLEQKDGDRRASVAARHSYGQAGSVFPDLNGHETSRP